MGVPSNQVSFFQTCAAAISQVALGLRLQPGAEIVLPDQEYPSNAYPWHRAAERAGGRVVLVPSDPDLAVHVDRIISAIKPQTRVVALSWVQFQSGATVDLAPIAAAAHAHGAWLVVDAIQGLGVRAFDLAALGVDAVCGGTHKWLMGPLGHGFLALAPGRRAELTPLVHGAMTYGTPDDAVDPRAQPRDDPRRFEPGAPLLVGAIAGAASIALLNEIGLARIAAENQQLRERVVTHAAARGFSVLQPHQGHSAIVTMRLPNDSGGARAAAKVAALRQAGISVAARGGGIRVAPHIHNTGDDIDRLFSALDTLA